MSTFKAKADAANRNRISAAKLLSSSALTAAGLLAFAIGTARADDVVIPDTPAVDPVAAPWTGFETESGDATFETPSSTMTNITQNSSLYVGTSSHLDIPEGYHVNIDQSSPNWLFAAKAAPDADPTFILGRLTADGRVIIIDRNGVFFGANSQVDVAGIVATTGDLTIDQLEGSEFGQYQITNVTEGRIDLQGQITVANAGLAAFVAPTVVNSGVINAKLGKVAIASGEVVTLDLYGDNLVEIAVEGNEADALLENSGVINAEGGVVQISAKQAKEAVDNIINVNGVVDVSSVTQQGGKIVLSGGNAGAVTVSGELKANGKSGGNIAAKGQNIEITDTAYLSADGTEGDGGTAFIFGDNYALFNGTLSARSQSGKGGAAEISAGDGVAFLGLVDLSSETGENGTLLIDPKNLTISTSSTSGVLADILSGGNSNVNVNDQALANTLRYSNVNLWATETLNTGSDIDISTWDGLFGTHGITSNDLTLAAPTINIVHDVILGNGDLNIFDLAPGTSVLGLGLLNVPASGIQVDIVNLNGVISKRGTVGGLTTEAGDDQINSQANTVNVQSNDARIQQGVYLANDAGGGTVNVAAGTYIEQVEIAKDLTLKGANAGISANGGVRGAETIIKSPADLLDAYVSPYGEKRFVVYAHDADVVVDGFTVDGDHQGNANYSFGGIGFFDAGGEIKNTEVKGTTDTPLSGNQDGNGIMVSNYDGDARTVSVTNNYVHDFQKNGITFNEAGLAGTISGNKVVGQGPLGLGLAAQNGIQIGYDANATVSGNTISGIGYTGGGYDAASILVYDAGNDVNIENNTITGTGYDLGIAIIDTADAEVTGNTVTGSAIGTFVDPSPNVIVSGNLYNNIAGHAIEVYNSTGAQILSNVIGYTDLTATVEAGANNIQGDGILLDGANGAVVKGNKIAQTTGPGAIEVLNTDVANIGGAGVGEGNRIRNSNGGDGVRMQNSSNLTVEGNDIDGTNRVGIWGGNVNTASILGNTVVHDNLGGYGSIHADGGSSWTVSGNTIGNKFPDNFSAGDIGIFLNSVGGTNAINNNTVDSTTSDGIRAINTGNLTISGNFVGDFSFIGGDGIYVDNSAGVQITNNYALNTTKNGIYVVNSNGAVISGSGVSATGQDGIAVVNSDNAQILNNDTGTLSGPGNVQGDGVSVTDSDGATLSGNEIRNSGINGVHLDNATNNTITGNQILDSGQVGVLVENGSTVTALTGNTFNGTPTYIKNTVAGTDIYAGNNTFNTLVAHPGYNPFNDGFDAPALFELEDKTVHIMDNASYGKVTYIDGELFVTESTLGIQHAIDISDTYDTVNVDDGDYYENVLIDKAGIKLRGFGTTMHLDTVNDGPGRGLADRILYITANDVNVDPIIFDGGGVAAYGITNFGNNVIIDGNTFKNFVGNGNSTGFGVWSQANNVEIKNNTFFDNAGSMRINGGNDNKITNNTLDGGLWGVLLTFTGNNNVVSGNTVGFTTGTSDNGIYIYQSTGATTVSGNHVYNAGWDGINVNGATGTVNVAGNDVHDTKGASGIAVVFSNGGVTIDNNQVFNSARLGIYDGFSNNVNIKNNTVFNSGTIIGTPFHDGIFVESGDNVTIDNNVVDTAVGAGIRVGGVGNNAPEATTGIVIKNNKVQNAGNDGISVQDSNGVQITGNKVGYEADGTTSAGNNNIHGDGIFVNNSDAAVIKGNTITETQTTGADKGSGIQVINSDNVVIGGANNTTERNTITNSDWDGIRLQNNNNVTVENSVIDNVVRVGIWGGNINIAKILNNVVGHDNLAGYGSIHADGGTSWTVTGNDVDYGDYGIFLNGVGGATNLVNNNKVDNVTANGIHVLNTSGLTVSGNQVGVNGGNVGGTGIFVDPSNVAQLFDNVILNVGGNGIWSLNNNDANIYHNTITGVGLDGILVQGGNNVTIGGANATFANIVTNSGDDGIAVENTTGNVLVKYNTVDGTGLNAADNNYQNGIEVFGTTNAIIDNNTVKKSAWDGINVRTSNGTKITNNTVSDTLGASGIAVVDTLGVIANSLIEGNTVTNSNEFGIFAYGHDGTLNINNNKVRGAVLYSGIFTYDSNEPVITNNQVDGPINLDGIHVEGNGTKATITGNWIGSGNNHAIGGAGNNADTFIGQDGIYVTNSAASIIKSNLVLNTGKHGIELLGSANSVIGGPNNADANVIVNTTVDGVHVENSNNVTVQKNEIYDNGDDGIDVYNSASAQILSNKVGKSGAANKIIDNGIEVTDSATANITGNTITNVGNNGIQIDPSPNSTIYGNTISNAVHNGIYSLDNDNITIGGFGANQRNTISDVGDNGILVVSTNNAAHRNDNSTIQNNKITNAGIDGIQVKYGRDVIVDGNLIQATNGGPIGSAAGKNGAGRDGIHMENSHDAIIRNNQILGGAGAGLGSGVGGKGAVNDGIFVKDSDNTQILNNLVQAGLTIPVIGGKGGVGAGNNGIEVSGGKFVLIDNNQVKGGAGGNAQGATNDGIHVIGNQEARITNNKITGGLLAGSEGAGHDGIYAENSGSKLSGLANAFSTRDGVVITGNTITAAGLSKGAGHDGIHVLNSAGGLFGDAALVKDNTVTYVGNDGIFVDKTARVNVIHNGVTLAGDDGIEVDNSDLAQILNNTVTLSGDVGILVDPSSFTLTDGNTVTLSGTYGMWIDGGIANTVSNNNVTLSGDDGIHVDGNSLSKVINNTVTLSGNDGVEINGGALNLVDGNTITLSDANGVNFHDSALGKVTNNIITLSGNDGVNADNAQAIEVGNNTITLSGNDGIHVTDSLLANIHDNTVTLSGGNGIFLDGSALAKIVNNIVTLSGADGIFANDVLGLTIDSNIVTLSGDDGIDARNVIAGDITNNIVTLSANDGIALRDSALVDINDNIVTLSGGNGIFVDPSIGINVIGNIVTLSGLDGINAVDVLGLNVQNNIVTLSGDDGIDVSNSALVDISNNIITLSADDGIQVVNVLGLGVNNNIVTLSGDDGIDVDSVAGFSIDHNIVTLSADNGIELSDAGLGTVNNNIVTLSGNDGIHAEGIALVGINNNIITLSGDDGIDVDGAALFSIDNNIVTLSGDNGIQLSDAALGTVNNNILTLSGNDGIHAEGIALTSINGNIVTLSADDGIDVDGALLSSIDGNIVTLSGDNGIQANNLLLSSIDGNIVTLSGNNGIDLRNSAFVSVDNNIVTLSGNNGIFVDPSFFIDVSGNIVTLSGNDGIHVEDVLGLTVNNNIVTLSGNDGIDVDGVALYSIDGNIVTLSGDNGIELSNALFGTVNGNIVTLSGDDGINVQNALFTGINNNIVTLSGDDGIDADDVLFTSIDGNIVTLSGNNGIELSDAGFTSINGNIVTLSGNDGIHVDDTFFTDITGNIVTLSGDDGIDVDDSLFADINSNFVTLSGNNGIEVTDSPFVDIIGNVVLLSGNDGINVDNSAFADITNNIVAFAFGDGIDVDDSFAADINNNLISFVAGDGIEVTDSAFVDIIGNGIFFTGDDGIDVRNSFGADINNNGIFFTAGDGIQVRNSDFAEIDNNFIRFAGDDGIDFENGTTSEINGNDIRFVNHNGIEINDASTITIDSNTIADADDAGIFIDPSFDIFVTNNNVSNSKIGLYVQGPGNGYIKIAGNTFTDNDIGALFESGQIDISDLSNPNTFRNTDPGATPVGMIFDGDPSELSIVGETLGGTIFEGFTNPGSFYVQFTDGSIMSGGFPIIIDGMNAIFDGISPLDPSFSPADLAFIEARLFDADDPAVNGRGQIFVGSFSGLDNDEDFFNEFSGFSSGPSGFFVTILGLPSVGGAGGGVSGAALNAISPAAGGDDTTEKGLASIEPAAGEGATTEQPANSSVSCWGDAVNAAGSGTAVNYSYGGSLEDSISAAAGCGTQSF